MAGDANMSDAAAAYVVNDDCARSSKHQRERAYKFGNQFFHAAILIFAYAYVICDL